MPFDHQAAEAAAAPHTNARSEDVDGSAGGAVRPLQRATPASMLRLQRLAGNAAVQRAVTIDELSVTPTGPTDGGRDAGTTGAAAPVGNTLGDGSSPTSINGPTLDVNAPVVNLNSGMVNASGVVRAQTIIADSVIASSYSPGAGNLF